MNRITGLPIQETKLQGQRQLATGQIVQGKVLKIYPNQKALIQIGGQKMVAQLEAPLSVGERYHFQATVTDQTIYLRVLGEQSSGNNEASIAKLLSRLGLASGKNEVSFTQSLMDSNIPFQKDQLKAAFSIMQSIGGEQKGAEILKSMLAGKIPLTENIFKALEAAAKNSLGKQMSQMLDAIQKAQADASLQAAETGKTVKTQDYPSPALWGKLKTKLLANPLQEANQGKQTMVMPSESQKRTEAGPGPVAGTARDLLKETETLLGRMTNRSQFLESLFLKQYGASFIENKAVFDTFKNAGLISKNTTFEQWQQEWKTYAHRLANAAPEEAGAVKLPFGRSGIEIIQTLRDLAGKESKVQQAANNLLERFRPSLEQLAAKGEAPSPAVLATMRRQIEQRLIPIMTQDQGAAIRSMLANLSERMPEMLKMLQELAANQPAGKLLAQLPNDRQWLMPQIKDQFLAHMQQMAEEAGFLHERAVAEDQAAQAAKDLKSLLIKLTGMDVKGIQEPGRQLLHLINGIQLQMVQETDHVIQASLQLPGGALGIPSDIEMNFEGKKEKDGTLNPEFCRVLFYLDLENLKETAIDMNIQKRNVSVTVYNNHEQIKDKSAAWEPLLNHGLETHGYRLTQLVIKPFGEQTDTRNQTPVSNVSDASYRKVDFRI